MKRLRNLVRYGVLTSMSAWDSIFSKEKHIGSSKLVQVVNLHHLYEREQQPFREFLAWFSDHYQVIPYSEAARRVKTGDIDAAYGAITFDDGLESNVTAGKILAEFNISATFFVCPAIIGETDPQRLKEFCQQSRMSFESNKFVSWQELDQLKTLNHEIGNHTASHVNISQISLAEAEQEIGQAQELLEQKLGPVRDFSWPFGRFHHLGRPGFKLLENFNFDSIASGERGAHAAGSAALEPNIRWCLRRDNIEARWPLSHIRYFLIRNALHPVAPTETVPSDWSTLI